ncbi:Muscle, skeletal receptor tyrosine protein kinase [Amphibalanus amphitrite]|uniref:receptor protein-tyrosine kinase n=1 Tax=Amphibalanus amphitrite TaxID=1232801 RepID=A0A6A4V084_AMPAM|nr:Muscle, skeletal receptor tyrosine protein kinase [Amphibalanus amphitrite]
MEKAFFIVLLAGCAQGYATTSAPEITVPPASTDVELGSELVLNCSSRGEPVPRILWRFRAADAAHYRELDAKGDNHAVGEDGRLRVHKVSRTDEGRYLCRVWNSLGERTASADVKVLVPVTVLKTHPMKKSVASGALVTLGCDLGGEPLPAVTWLFHGDPVVQAATYPPLKRFVHSELFVRPAVSSDYVCQGSNTVLGTPRIAAEQVSVSVLGAPRTGYGDSPLGYCATYVGKVCRRHLSAAPFVWYNTTYRADGAGGTLDNEHAVARQLSHHAADLSGVCRPALESLLCSVAFPQCRQADGAQTALPPCREDCLAVKQLFCANEWYLLVSGQKLPGHLALPDCDQLPQHGDGSAHRCSHAGLTVMLTSQVTYDCVRDRGRFYQGRVNTTADGILCQRWDSDYPHDHSVPVDLFPELSGAENYCRNAGGEEPQPWCFTTDPDVRWGPCDIPKCADNSTLYADDPAASAAASGRSRSGGPAVSAAGDGDGPTLAGFPLPLDPVFLLVLAIAGVTGLIMTGMAVYGCCHCRRARQRAAQRKEAEAIDLTKLPANASYHQHEPLLPASLEPLEYARNDIIYVRDLGQGAFGRVFQAKAPDLVQGEDFTMVAVKMLKDEATEDMERDFEREARLLAGFDHPNIVRLLAVCAVGKPLCLLFEFMDQGDLNEYLRQASPKNVIIKHETGEIFSDSTLSHLDMTVIAQQIASGMQYLAERQFVHRDLACRNCLINEEMIVKIADFGLSQKICSNYFRGDEHDAIPVRWMPLESILYNKYTLHSDVWAFGVVLWEIFSFALQPYFGMTHEEVVRHLKDGQRLKRPENTPRTIHQLMRDCWAAEPTQRPTFAAIVQRLQEFQDRLDQQMGVYGYTTAANSTYTSRAPSIGSPSTSSRR